VGGEGEAAFSLSGLYLTGSPHQRVEQDESKALYWVRAAAERGLAKAQFALGFFYEKGIGMEKEDIAEAFKWYQTSAANGDEKAIQKVATRKPPKSSSTTTSVVSTNSGSAAAVSSSSISASTSSNMVIKESSSSPLRNSIVNSPDQTTSSSPVPIVLSTTSSKKKSKNAGKCIIM
jgi:TPR repeat protein